MILYVNGDSHTAAAEAVNNHAFAEDDGDLWPAGREPHPDNLEVSWGKKLADRIGYDFVCDAESASSNDRIMRTTKQYLQSNSLPDLIILQWSTWEREEWLIGNTYYQINASGTDHVPESYVENYKNFVTHIDWEQKTLGAHLKIFNFHLYLETLNVPHLFFNGNNTFSNIINRVDWNNSYYEPYKSSFDIELCNKFKKRNGGYHYGSDAHTYWADFLCIYLVDNNLI